MALKMDLMKDLDLSGARVLIREDFNVPLKNGEVRISIWVIKKA